jgi:hypothetical protein
VGTPLPDAQSTLGRLRRLSTTYAPEETAR